MFKTQQPTPVKLTAKNAFKISRVAWRWILVTWPADLLIFKYLGGTLDVSVDALASLAVLALLATFRKKIRIFLQKILHLQKNHRKKIIWGVAVVLLIPVVLEFGLRAAPILLQDPTYALVIGGLTAIAGWRLVKQIDNIMPRTDGYPEERIEMINRVNLGIAIGSAAIARMVSVLGALSSELPVASTALLAGAVILLIAAPERADFFARCPRCKDELSLAVLDFGACPRCEPDFYRPKSESK